MSNHHLDGTDILGAAMQRRPAATTATKAAPAPVTKRAPAPAPAPVTRAAPIPTRTVSVTTKEAAQTAPTMSTFAAKTVAAMPSATPTPVAARLPGPAVQPTRRQMPAIPVRVVNAKAPPKTAMKKPSPNANAYAAVAQAAQGVIAAGTRLSGKKTGKRKVSASSLGKKVKAIGTKTVKGANKKSAAVQKATILGELFDVLGGRGVRAARDPNVDLTPFIADGDAPFTGGSAGPREVSPVMRSAELSQDINQIRMIADGMAQAADLAAQIYDLCNQLDAAQRSDVANQGDAIVQRYNALSDEMTDPVYEDGFASEGAPISSWFNKTNALASSMTSWIATAQSTLSSPGTPGVDGGPWAPNTPYMAGRQVANGSNLYVAVINGVSGSSGGPTGTGTGIVDGSVKWNYAGVATTATDPYAGMGMGGGGGGGSSGGDDPFGDAAAEGEDPFAQEDFGQEGEGEAGYGEEPNYFPGSDEEQLEYGSRGYGEDPGYTGPGYTGPGYAGPYGTEQAVEEASYDEAYTPASAEYNEEEPIEYTPESVDYEAPATVEEEASTAAEQVVGREEPTFTLSSPLAGVPDKAWTKFVVAMRGDTKVGEVSDSNDLGMFKMRPRRLADLGMIKNHRRVHDPKTDKQIWVGEFTKGSPKDFLRSPALQYQTFVGSMTDYVQGMKNGSVPTPEGGRPKDMSLSGALAVLHRCGPKGMRTWNDGERFESTQELYDRVNGIF